MENNLFANTDDYTFSFSDEVMVGTMQKLQSALGDGDSPIKAYAANVLIGNEITQKVNDSVGVEFILRGYHCKKFKYKDSDRSAVYTVMFGTLNSNYCAFSTTSEKIYESIMHILYVYGDVTNWNGGIAVKIKANALENGKAYCLEIIG